MGGANLIDKLYSRISQPLGLALEAVVAAAEKAHLSIYLVGGSVRDLLLGRPTVDVDLLLEGDATALARGVAQALAARCLAHPAFGTATIKGRGFAFDIATARIETYPRPGSLPKVRPAALAQDLARRDFTINAMALALAGSERGRLLDPHSGYQDLRRGLVRVLHDDSFRDDATRILRALRYATRLRFAIEEHTLGLLRRDVGYLEAISGARLRRELLRLLDEVEPERALLAGQQLGVLAAIHPALAFDKALADAFASARRETRVEPLPLVYLAILASPWAREQAEAVTARCALTKAQREVVVAMPSLLALVPQLAVPDIRPSQVVDLLSPFPAPSLWALVLTTTDARAAQQMRRYLEEWRYVKPSLNGDALLALGVPAGPALGHLLRALRAARLDGEIKTREEEVAFVRGALARHR